MPQQYQRQICIYFIVFSVGETISKKQGEKTWVHFELRPPFLRNLFHVLFINSQPTYATLLLEQTNDDKDPHASSLLFLMAVTGVHIVTSPLCHFFCRRHSGKQLKPRALFISSNAHVALPILCSSCSSPQCIKTQSIYLLFTLHHQKVLMSILI